MKNIQFSFFYVEGKISQKIVNFYRFYCHRYVKVLSIYIIIRQFIVYFVIPGNFSQSFFFFSQFEFNIFYSFWGKLYNIGTYFTEEIFIYFSKFRELMNMLSFVSFFVKIIINLIYGK
jgi:hypothetical protein